MQINESKESRIKATPSKYFNSARRGRDDNQLQNYDRLNCVLLAKSSVILA
jgi:hypothetical protein